MKKIFVMLIAAVAVVALASGNSFAISKEYQRKGKEVQLGGKDAKPYQDPAQTDAAESAKAPKEKKVKAPKPEFPEKGWHKGVYVGANIGLVQVSNDTHIITARQFGSWQNLGYGLTVGWDITDWIGPLFQLNFSTKTAQVGDVANNTAVTAYPSQPLYTFPVGTFPTEQARQYQVDVGLFAKATLPYFTRASWQPKIVKIIPYAKVGGAGNAVYVNASTATDKSGAFGGGPAVGAGCEFFIWKGFFVALDFTEYFIYQVSIKRNITVTPVAGGPNVPINFELTEGGLKPHFSLMGILGWHF